MITLSGEPVAIVVGRGNLPVLLIEALQRQNKKFSLFLLESEKYEIDYSSFDPITLPYDRVGRFLEVLKYNQVKTIIFAGSVTKPNFSQIKPDAKGLVLLSKILANKILGDDAVLNTVIKFFEKEGFKIVGADKVLDCIIAKKGVLTELQPTAQDIAAIKIAQKAIKTMSSLDIGQSLIIAQRQIIAVEALEGTDNLIARCATLPQHLKCDAILVKTKKNKQSLKADLPTIGIETIKNCYAANIKGIAIQAKSTLVLDREKIIEFANQHQMFFVVI